MNRHRHSTQRLRRTTILMAVVLTLAAAGGSAHGGWLQEGKELLEGLKGERSSGAQLSAEQIGAGLKEALRVGTERVVGQLGRTDGFNSDPAVHIPLPQSLDTVKSTLEKVGMDSLLADLELKLNRAAEVATPKAKALFWDAISRMTLGDVRAIYQGPNDAATQYFRGRMSEPLVAEMSPIVTDSLAEVGAIEAYDNAMARYRDVPFVPDVKADLTDHVVAEGVDGIFYYLAREEAAIRKDPAKRTTELLKKVFGASRLLNNSLAQRHRDVPHHRLKSLKSVEKPMSIKRWSHSLALRSAGTSGCKVARGLLGTVFKGRY
jgi:hypothetical protein